MSLWDVFKIGRGAVRVIRGTVLDEVEDIAKGGRDLVTGFFGLFTGAKATEGGDSSNTDSDNDF